VSDTSFSTAEDARRLFNVTDSDLDALRRLGEHVAPKMDTFVKEFYVWLKKLPEFEVFFPDQTMVEHVKTLQREYWQKVFDGEVDQQYIDRRQTVGEVHARIGLPLGIYFAAMNHAVTLFSVTLYDSEMEADDYAAGVIALHKVASMDTALVVDTYARISNEAAVAQSKAIMEMSTPVTQIWEGILLLPLVGLIDSKRAQDIMDASLAKIAESQARIFILDISGVGVVDTAVANYLIKVTKATRLMGCESTISGVSPAIAQTITELGIDVGDVRTTANMRDALSLALKAQDETKVMSLSTANRIPLQMSNNCLVASIQIDLTADVLKQFREDLLTQLHAEHARGIILDLSGIEVMDLSDFENIRSTISMAKVMGVSSIVCGMRPGVVASIVLLGADTDDIWAARDLDMAFELLNESTSDYHS
jgi:rsbT co-antagonist protein RsbR